MYHCFLIPFYLLFSVKIWFGSKLTQKKHFEWVIIMFADDNVKSRVNFMIKKWLLSIIC